MDPQDVLSALSDNDQSIFTPTGRIKKVGSISRAEVIRTFQLAFECIGGVPRLALWADENPEEFYKLYGRLLPSSNSQELDGPQELIIRHVLPPPSPLATLEVAKTHLDEDNPA